MLLFIFAEQQIVASNDSEAYASVKRVAKTRKTASRILAIQVRRVKGKSNGRSGYKCAEGRRDRSER